MTHTENIGCFVIGNFRVVFDHTETFKYLHILRFTLGHLGPLQK